MRIHPLEWDSNFFNISIGKFEVETLTPNELDKLLKLKLLENYDIVYLFLSEELNVSVFPFVCLMDKKVVFQKKSSSLRNKHNDIIEEFSGELTSDLLKLAIDSGHQSRFKKDPKLSPKFEELYQNWIEKSITGELADKIFVSKQGDEITGFVTIKKKGNYSQIGLIAVSENYRGQGIGRRLLEKVDSWNKGQGIEQCEVTTQLDNVGACSLYKKQNYSVKSVQYVYHL